ncbi:hypothetical protein EWF20_11860 [Sulfolobus sp. S-194]|uniref:hypothetical protein n=1 Tax=Sulfolobus sp. S-194 TaxID=2512240 RepID=UPI001436CDF2|nr:hypothetical protein [Sulfolobus sp. S-194]QIW24761.1 hypothetical protein EWF20_11860 [Sulfolobus sp. S-194]
MLRKINKATNNALLFLLLISLRLLSLEKLMILFLPFLIASDSTFFLINIALIPLAVILLIMSAMLRFYQIIVRRVSSLHQS